MFRGTYVSTHFNENATRVRIDLTAHDRFSLSFQRFLLFSIACEGATGVHSLTKLRIRNQLGLASSVRPAFVSLAAALSSQDDDSNTYCSL